MTRSFDASRRAPGKHLVWDMVLPLAPVVGNDFELLARYYAAGHDYVSLTIAGDDCGLAEAVHRLAGARRRIQGQSEHLVLALSAEDVIQAKAQGKLAVGLHLEGTECLERDPDVIDLMYQAGIRHAILAFNQNNSAAGGCGDLGDVGLSRLGRRYLERMREVGMLLDVSHMSERASLEAIEQIDAPVVATHSNAQALHQHYRNLSDAQAKACAESGGLVGISGSSAYLGPQPTLAEGVFRHIDHFVQTIGIDHVGFGTDYVHDADALVRIVAERPDEWPVDDQVNYATLSYLPPEGIHEVIRRMERAGYDDDAVGKVAGGNYLRVARAVWH